MSRFVGTISNSQSGNNKFAWVIDTSISDRTVTASFKIFAQGAWTPYYQWQHTVKCVVGGTTVLNTQGQYPSQDGQWVACSESISGTTYNRVYTVCSGSYSVGNSGGSVTSSFSYTVTGSADYLPTTGTKTASGTDTVGAKTGSFNLNILLPDGSEPYSTGAAGSVEFSSNGGSSYTRLYNEPSNSYVVGTSFVCRNFTPGTGLHLSGTSGFNSNGGSGPWYATQGSATVLSFSTAWNTYTIAYNANGGSGAPGSQTKTYGTNLILSSTKPSRTGYTFLGWSTSGSASSASYSAGGTLSSDLTTTNGATITLYAVWEANAPHSLSLSGTDNSTSSISVKLTASSAITITNYTVYYKTTSAISYSSKSFGTSTTGSITDLSADTNYNIYFTATNATGTTTSGAITYSTKLGNPTITTPVVSNLLPFSCTISATGSISPSRTLTYRFSKDGGSTWTSYQSSNTYSWTGLSEEISYNMGVQVKATHTGGNSVDTTAASYLTITTPADQAKIRIKKDEVWAKGKAYYKKDGTWAKVKKIYIKIDGKWKINKEV